MEFLEKFSWKSLVPYFIKVLPIADELIRADRRTDMTKLIVAFHHLCEST